MDTTQVTRIFETLTAKAETPVTDIAVKRRHSAFKSLVACLLSAQSRDARTKQAADALFDVGSTPRAILALEDDVIAQLIKPCGLYNVKARNLKRLCAALLRDHDGRVPQDRQSLMALPGIGRKCADIMLRFVFGEPTIAVDTHVFRVARRLGLSGARTESGVAADLERIVPEPFKMAAHMLLLEHGKRLCRARAPRCPICPLASLCAHQRAAVAAGLPASRI